MIFKEVVSSLGEYDLTAPKLLNVIFRLQQNSYSEKKKMTHILEIRLHQSYQEKKKKKNPHLERKAKLNGCFSISL